MPRVCLRARPPLRTLTTPSLRKYQHHSHTMKSTVSLLLCLAAAAWTADAALYQVVVYAVSPPDGALDTISSYSLKILDKFIDHEPSYTALGPGQATDIDTYSVRKLGTEEGVEEEEKESPSSNFLRGSPEQRRDLQAGSQCPAKCASSGSTYCRNIGCAYCGSSCRRRLLSQQLSATDGWSIKSDMNTFLAQFCNNAKGCSITAEILLVHNDGSTSKAF